MQKNERIKVCTGFEPSPSVFAIKVIGVGGGAVHILNGIQTDSNDDLQFIAIDSDADSLKFTKRVSAYTVNSLFSNNIPVDFEDWLSGGRAVVDSTPRNSKLDFEKLRQGILENAVENMWLFSDVQLVIFIVCLGGETGSTIAPILANIAGFKAELTLVFATTPAEFESAERHERAMRSLREFEKTADTVFHIPMNGAVVSGENANPSEVFARFDEIVIGAVRAVTESLYSSEGLCCVDFPDLRFLFGKGKKGFVANGWANGEEKARQVLENALGSENLLIGGIPLKDAKNVWMFIEGDEHLCLDEVEEMVFHIEDLCAESTNIIFAPVVNKQLKDSIHLTLLASGYD